MRAILGNERWITDFPDMVLRISTEYKTQNMKIL